MGRSERLHCVADKNKIVLYFVIQCRNTGHAYLSVAQELNNKNYAKLEFSMYSVCSLAHICPHIYYLYSDRLFNSRIFDFKRLYLIETSVPSI